MAKRILPYRGAAPGALYRESGSLRQSRAQSGPRGMPGHGHVIHLLPPMPFYIAPEKMVDYAKVTVSQCERCGHVVKKLAYIDQATRTCKAKKSCDERASLRSCPTCEKEYHVAHRLWNEAKSVCTSCLAEYGVSNV